MREIKTTTYRVLQGVPRDTWIEEIFCEYGFYFETLRDHRNQKVQTGSGIVIDDGQSSLAIKQYGDKEYENFHIFLLKPYPKGSFYFNIERQYRDADNKYQSESKWHEFKDAESLRAILDNHEHLTNDEKIPPSAEHRFRLDGEPVSLYL
ncbi:MULTISPECIES: hypothetical protein [unclassified Carboxylicivirga]|uniref:hypothetical protein n=1 Tax=Carboxylicivirga TaxID=1628153 RepID=UPI003D3346BE